MSGSEYSQLHVAEARRTRVETPVRCPLFVTGFPRSGTTLVRAMLSAHSSIQLVNEPSLIHKLRLLGFRSHHRLDRDDRRRLLESLWPDAVEPDHHAVILPSDVIESFLEYQGTMPYRTAYEWLLPRPAEEVVWGEKSLNNLFFVDDLHAIYPNALYVHMVRDPRATLLSVYRKRYCHSASLLPPLTKSFMGFFAFQSLLWKRWMMESESAAAIIGANSLMHVRYNNLVRDPESEMSRICKAVGVSYEESVLQASKRRDDVVLSSSSAYAHTKIAAAVDPSRAEARRELPEWAAYIVETMAEPIFSKWGYVHEARPPRPLRMLIDSGLKLYRSKLELRVEREINAYYGDSGDKDRSQHA